MSTVSVVVCTLDRAPSLDRLLWSLVAQSPNGDAMEVVVVDNGSRDRTADVVASFASRLPAIQYVREPVTGLSVARNTGVSASQGQVVAFVDDDAEAGPGWVGALAGRFTDSAVGAVGGRVELVFPTGWPDWLPERLSGHYAGLDLGPNAFCLDAPKVPYGTNMAFRRELLCEVGAFEPSLGRRGRSLISNEEVELFSRVRASGAAVWYEPGAVVHHHVELERATRHYLLRRAFAQGRSAVRQEVFTARHRTRRQWLRGAVGASSALVRIGGSVVAGAPWQSGRDPRAVMLLAGRAANRAGYAVEALSFAARGNWSGRGSDVTGPAPVGRGAPE